MLKIKTRVVAFILASLFSLLFTACAQLDSHDKGYRFNTAEEGYRGGMRWGEWDSVLYLIRAKPEKVVLKVDSPNEKKYQVIEIPKNENTITREELLVHLGTIKVKQIEVLSTSISGDGVTAESRFKILYRFDHSAKLNTLRHKVSWWYDKDTNTWFSETPLPKEFEPPKADPSKRKTIRLSPN